MRKRLIALMLMAIFAFEQTNVLTAFAEEYNYMPIYDKYGNTVNVEDVLSSRDAGNYVTIYDSAGNEVNIDDVVAEAAEKNKTNDSSSSSEYTPIYDELGNEVNPVDVLASEKTGINIPIYDDNGNTINPIDLEGKLYNLYGSEFRYIKVYDEAGNEIDWCGLLNNVEEWNARGFYTVTYVDSFDNSVIDTIVVPKDASVTQIPTPPVHENYTFLTWVGNSNNVQKNETVTAVYLESTPKLDVFGYAGELDFIEFYVYGSRNNYDGVLTSDLSQVNLKLNDYTWTDDMGNVFVPNEDGNFVDQRDGNVFITYIESETPKLSIDTNVSFETKTGNTVVTTNKDSQKALSAATKIAKDATKATMKKIILDLKDLNPYLSWLKGPLDSLVDVLFGLDSKEVSLNDIAKKIDDVNENINKAEAEIKLHSEVLSQFAYKAEEFQKVTNASGAVTKEINDILRNYEAGGIDKDTCDKQIAALYEKSSKYSDLVVALEGATNALKGKTSQGLKETSIMQDAYDLQCSKVMFSGEAVDAITPYLSRQMLVYLQGYAVENVVLDAYENVHGPTSVLASREEMFVNTGGVINGQFDPTNPGIFGLYENFYKNTNRYTYVNKAIDPGKYVTFKPNLLPQPDFARISMELDKEYFNARMNFRSPDRGAFQIKALTQYAMSKEQVENIAKYCSDKKITIRQYFQNVVGFQFIDCGFPNLNFEKNCYLLVGPQTVQYNSKLEPYYDCININEVGATSERIYMWSIVYPESRGKSPAIVLFNEDLVNVPAAVSQIEKGDWKIIK